MSKEIVSKDNAYLVIKFDTETFNNLEYYKTEVKRLEETIERMKINYSSIIDKGKYIESLEAFRKLFLLEPCLVGYKNLNISRITIIQCGENIKDDRCKMSKECKPRSELMKKLIPII